LACRIEDALWAHFQQTDSNYLNQVRSIKFNLGDSKNSDFARKVLEGDIDPKRMPTITAQEMASQATLDENKKMMDRAIWEIGVRTAVAE